MKNKRRCVLLFARTPKQEALSKGLGREVALFEFARSRVGAAAVALDGVDLLVPRQCSGSFGEKLSDAFGQALALGYDQIVAVPIDVPSLGADDLADAFDALRTHEVVLGPSPDGGVYLLGMGGRGGGRVHLNDVRWLTSSVAADLMACFPGAAVLTHVIADVDRRADLALLDHDTALDPELAVLLLALLASPRTDSPESTIPHRITPAVTSAGRAPPAPLSSI